MKRNGKLLITFGLIITMLFGNIMTLYAKTTNSVLADLAKYFTYINTASAVFATVNNKTYDYSVFTWKSDKPCYVTYVENPNSYMEEQGLNGGYAGTFLIVSNESEIQWGYSLINTDEKGIEECLNREITFKKNGWTKTIQDENGQDWYVYDLGLTVYRPVNSYDFMMLRTEHTLKEFINLLFTGTLDGNVDITGSVTSGDIDETLYLKNIRWKTEALTGSGGKEDCYCFMSWDTNNLLVGDTVDIRVDSWYQHYILGKNVSGVYDVITNKSVDDFSSTSWSHAYSYGLDLLKGSLYFDYLTFPMLYANSIDNSIKNIYNGGVSTMYLRLNRLDSKTGKLRQGLWVKVNFKESSVSYPDIDSIQAGTIDEETGIFTPNNNTDYGENGYGINGETGNIVPPNGGGNFGDIDSIDELGEYLFNSLKKLFASLGQFPSFLSSVFSFIPLPIIALIGGSIVVVIILRILGR